MLNAKNTGIGSRMFRSQYLTTSSGRIEQKILPMMFAPAVVEMTIVASGFTHICRWSKNELNGERDKKIVYIRVYIIKF